MKRLFILMLYGALCSWLYSCGNDDITPRDNFPGLRLPAHFGAPTYDISSNPVTKAGFELGKELFNDPLLSVDNTISCTSCHLPEAAFTQPAHPLSHGVNDLFTNRNSQPIQNLAWNTTFLWDGGIFHLDLFAPSPITAHNEMGETMANVLNKLRNSPKYPQLFQAAFGSSEINTDRFLKALSQFQLMCISDNSPFDRYFLNNKKEYLSERQLIGLNIFNQKCATCHSGVLQTDHSFRRNGLRILNPLQKGRSEVTWRDEDIYKFRVPSLRNIGFTAPYMHDGRFETLDEVLNHYSSQMEDSPNLDPIFKKPNGEVGIDLTIQDKEDIKLFLRSLNDTSFVRNPLLAP